MEYHKSRCHEILGLGCIEFGLTDSMFCKWNTGALDCEVHVQMCGRDNGIDYQHEAR